MSHLWIGSIPSINCAQFAIANLKRACQGIEQALHRRLLDAAESQKGFDLLNGLLAIRFTITRLPNAPEASALHLELLQPMIESLPHFPYLR